MQMRIVLGAVVLLGAIGCGGGSSHSPESKSAKVPSPSQDPSWQEFSPKDKSFTVSLPGAPEIWPPSTLDFADHGLPEHGKTEVQHAGVEFNGLLFGVNWHEYPWELTDAEVQSEVNSAVNLPGILASSEVQIGQTTGMQVVNKSGPIYMAARYFILQNRLYSLQVGGPKDPRNVDQANVDRFFNSFTLATSKAD